MSLSKSKFWYSNNCLYFSKQGAPLNAFLLSRCMGLTPVPSIFFGAMEAKMILSRGQWSLLYFHWLQIMLSLLMLLLLLLLLLLFQDTRYFCRWNLISFFIVFVKFYLKMSVQIWNSMPKRQNAKTPKRQNAKTPKCQNAKMPKCQNAKMPKRQNAKMLKRQKMTKWQMPECHNSKMP